MADAAPLPNLRIGLGYDSHRIVPGGPLQVGGISIPWDHHLDGHSDADVVLHALTDALLGAICQQDIGRLFPNTSADNADRDSRDFVNEAMRRVQAASMQVVNLDCVILAERPKMAPHIDNMRQAISKLLAVDISQVSVKAKTGEGVGEIGNGQSMACRVVVLLAGC